MEKEKLYPVNYQKPNKMIDLLYGGEIIDNKIMALAYAKITARYECDIESPLIRVSFTTAEICSHLGLKNNSWIYTKLKDSTQRLGGKYYFACNDKDKVFGTFSVFDNITYDNGVYTIVFGSIVSNLFRNIVKEHYTKFSLDTMLKFKSNASFRLYEEFRSKCFGRKDNLYHLTYSSNQLRFLLGTVDCSVLEGIKKEMQEGEDVYDTAIRKLRDNGALPFQLDKNFYSKCLYPAIREINDKSELNVDYKPIRNRWHLIRAFTFAVSIKEQAKKSDEATIMPDDAELVSFVRGLFPGLSERDIATIIKAADSNRDKITKAHVCWFLQKDNIDNDAAWIITAIKNDFEPFSRNSDKKEISGKKTAWNYKERNVYDSSQIEKMLLANNVF